MNRIILTILLVLAIALLPACTAELPADTTAASNTTAGTTGSTGTAGTTSATTAVGGQPSDLSMEDMSIEIDGNRYSLLGESAGLIAALGEPAAFSEAPSCLYEGTDKTYDYTDLVVYTITKGGVDLIDGIDLVSNRYATRRGIAVGADADSVIKAYGEPVNADYDLVYQADPSLGDSSPSLTFVLDGERVSIISLYSGSNNAAP